MFVNECVRGNPASVPGDRDRPKDHHMYMARVWRCEYPSEPTIRDPCVSFVDVVYHADEIHVAIEDVFIGCPGLRGCLEITSDEVHVFTYSRGNN